MNPADDAIHAAAPSDGLVLALAVCAAAPLVLVFLVPRRLAWSAFGVLIHPALAVVALRFVGGGDSPSRILFFMSGGAALGWSVLHMVLSRRSGASGVGRTHRECLIAVCRVAGLCWAIVSVLMLTGLSAYRVMAVLGGDPAPNGLIGLWGVVPWVTGGLILAGAAGVRATGDRRIVVGVFLLCVLCASWNALGTPGQAGVGGTGCSLSLLVGLSLVLCVFIGMHGWFRRRSMWMAVRTDPDALLGPIEEWPGFRKAAGAMSVLVVLIVCYELASAGATGDRGWAVLVFVCAGASGVATFSLLGERWSVNLAEVGMGLVTLSVSVLMLSALPSYPRDSASRFPMVFNGLMIGLGLMAGFWVWIGRVWAQQLDGDVAWTTAGRISRLSAGFAFFVALLALVSGSVMAIWPRLRPVGVFDDTLGRMSAAVAGHLWLLLVVLWSGRRTGRTGFDALAFLVGLSLVGFVAVRAGPLASRLHEGSATEARGVAMVEDGGR